MKYIPRGTVKEKSYVYARLCSVGRIKNQQITLSYRFDKNNTTDIHSTYNKVIKSFNISLIMTSSSRAGIKKNILSLFISTQIVEFSMRKRVVPSHTIQGPNSQLLAPHIWPPATNTCGALYHHHL
jgi:hypothetical protein